MIVITVKEILFTQKNTLYKDTNVLQGNILLTVKLSELLCQPRLIFLDPAWSSGKKRLFNSGNFT